MSKTVLYATIGAFVLLGLSVFAIYQNDTIEFQDKTITDQKKEIIALEESLDITIEEKHALLAENAALQKQVAILRDSVKMLNLKVKSLQGQLSNHKKVILELQSKLKSYESRYEQLKEQIAMLSREDEINKDKIQLIEAEKTEMREQMNSLNGTMLEKAREFQMTKEELMDLKASEAEMKLIADITDNTRVKFQHISLRKNRYGKPLKKLGKDGKTWRYTILEFQLDHPNIRQLIDERFMVKIIDTKTGEPLSHIEPNPAFPQSYIDTKGIEFKFDGNLVELAFRNNQVKSGRNYEIQVSYLKGKDEYILNNGVQSIILDSKPVKI